MFERLIVLDDRGNRIYFFVPVNISVTTFIENVKQEILTTKRYNSEIKKIKRQLDAEHRQISRTNNHSNEITADQATALIDTFVISHPMDDRTVVQILQDAGAVELINEIPECNIICDDEL